MCKCFSDKDTIKSLKQNLLVIIVEFNRSFLAIRTFKWNIYSITAAFEMIESNIYMTGAFELLNRIFLGIKCAIKSLIFVDYGAFKHAIRFLYFHGGFDAI